MMEKCALIISANESYQKGEKDLETFTGIHVAHSTLHRLVKSQEFELPTSKQAERVTKMDRIQFGSALPPFYLVDN